MSKNLGVSKDGLKIVARGIAEDNSGSVVEVFAPRGVLPGLYEVRTAYGYITDEGMIYENEDFERFIVESEAVARLKEVTGWARMERDGPGF